jgi:hypothetical protein
MMLKKIALGFLVFSFLSIVCLLPGCGTSGSREGGLGRGLSLVTSHQSPEQPPVPPKQAKPLAVVSKAASGQDNLIISIPSNLKASAGQQLIVPINIANAYDLTGAKLVIAYEPKILTFEKAALTNLTQGFLSEVKTTDKQIKIALAAAQEINGNGALLNLYFQVKPTTGKIESALILESVELYTSHSQLLTNFGIFNGKLLVI